MANLTFSDLENEVYAQSGLDGTDPTNQTNVDRWLNYVQQDLCARWPWPFMEGRESIVTVADYTTGTVSISSGGTTVTGVGTTFTSVMATGGPYFIQFSTQNDWYKITGFTSATSITIEQPYAQTSNASGVTFVVRKFFYSLSSAADRIVDIRNWNTPMKLVQVDARTIDDLNPLVESTNAPYGYLCWGYDASGSLQVQPYPFPGDARLMEIRTIKRPVDGTVSIPNKYAHVIAHGATSIAFASLRKIEMAQSWAATFDKRISEMKMEYRMSEDRQDVMRSIDSITRSKWLSLPDQYPTVRGGQ